ncbi:MAG: DnaJ domain-containing protein [Verrucomicrobiales bacterium]|nr:DnaJ domain-containing protein [Verrucomicrobiales bacterium]
MILNTDDFDDFRELHSRFMYFVSQRTPQFRGQGITRDLYMELSPNERLPVHEKFREAGPELIADYLKADPDNLTKAEREIIESWKLAEHGDFFVFRKLKKHMIFLGGKDASRAFGVLGLTQPVSELVHQLPASVATTLLPFRNMIVCDGMIVMRQISFGPGIKKSLNESYRLAKETSGIITDLTAWPVRGNVSRKKAKKKPSASQRIRRLVNAVHNKMKTVREKEIALKKFEEETEPAFRCWVNENYAEDKEKLKRLEQEIDDLDFIVREATHSYRYGSFPTGAKAVEAAEQDLEVQQVDEDLDDEDDFCGSKNPFDEIDDAEIPEFIFEGLFASFMKDVRGVDLDDLSPDEYQKARQQFTETMHHAQSGDRSAFEKALTLTGADESEDNVSAVKKVYRRLARKLHPDRNPDFGDEAQEIWNELKYAKQALDLDFMLRLETRWRVIKKETFSEEEEPALKEIQRDLSADLREINRTVKEYQTHPMWGVEGTEPPEEFKRELSEDFATAICDLEEQRDDLKAEIELIKKRKINKPSSPKKTPKSKTATKTAEKKSKDQVKTLPEQMTLDF